MKLIISLIFMFTLVFSSFGQEGSKATKTSKYRIVRSSLGIGGSSGSIVAKKGTFYVNQSIGQSSPIGTSSGDNGYYLVQGYQQPFSSIEVVSDYYVSNSLRASIYPNPFARLLSISFKHDISENIFVSIFDVTGKIVYNKQFSPAQIIELDVENLSSGTYLLKAVSNNDLFSAKLLKK